MGLIRKTLAVGTLGTVSGSSKKQKVAKATMHAAQATAAATAMQARLMAEMSGSVAARREALMVEMQALPKHHSSLPRIRQISRELKATAPPRPAFVRSVEPVPVCRLTRPELEAELADESTSEARRCQIRRLLP